MIITTLNYSKVPVQDIITIREVSYIFLHIYIYIHPIRDIIILGYDNVISNCDTEYHTGYIYCDIFDTVEDNICHYNHML